MRYRSNNILALLPPEDDEKQLVREILFFQDALQMRIFLYRIIKRPSFFKRIFGNQELNHLKADALSDLKGIIENRVPKALMENFSCRVKTGDPLPVLIRQSKRGGYEFILTVKATPGSCLTQEDTDKLISRTYCPVLLVTPDHKTEKIKKIIIPVDILQSTKKKLLWATYFAKKFQAAITIVSVLSINIDTHQSLAWRNSQKLKHMLTQRGVDCSVEILKAKGQEKHQVILDYINQEKPDMVIIRTHQESNRTGTHIGKFVSEIIHNCPTPVFTVNRFMNPMPVDFEF